MKPTSDPVAILPLDVLYHAFQYLKPTPSHDSPDSLKSHTPEILSLCHVSRSWRAAAFSFPLLWDSVVLYPPHKNGRVVAELLQEWMERSGKCRLSILLDDRSEHGSYQPLEHTQAMLQVLLNQSARWYNVTLWLPQTSPALFSDGSYDFPVLDSISLHFAEYDGPLKFPRINNAPNLRFLQVAGVQLTLDGKAFPQLTHFKSLRSTIRLEEILSRTPNLTHLDFQKIESDDPAYHPHRHSNFPASLPHLRVITMQGDCRALQTMPDAPSLRYIKIKGTIFRNSRVIQPLLQFMERNTFQHLHTLILAVVFPQDLDTLYRILDVADSVVNFCFHASEFSALPEALDPMAGRAGAGRTPKVILPNLEHFQYKTPKPDLEINPLINMIKHRWNGYDRLMDPDSSMVRQTTHGWSKLRSVYLGLRDELMNLLLDKIQVEIEEGLEVSYDTPRNFDSGVGFDHEMD